MPQLLLKASHYLSIGGELIEKYASVVEDRVNEMHKELRYRRDGTYHHITLVNSMEIKEIKHKYRVSKKKKRARPFLKDLNKSLIKTFGPIDKWETPVDLGLGSISCNEGESFYRIIHWPLGQRIRKALGLEMTHFHITVGFSPKDIHRYKGPASLVELQEGTCSKEKLNYLISLVPYYNRDKHFTHSLSTYCWKHGYVTEPIRLAGLCFTGNALD
ncbi:hypothetical protein BDB01DRAFT_789345 [Pilobolus umbonatus]|nr:hypothetical protein BDB01DRAFT_789345 [Pilobolus umbonatus]